MTRKRLVALGLAALFLGGGITGALLLLRGPCDQMVARFCACDMQFAENRRGCELAQDGERRRVAMAKARARHKDLDALCREKLDNFECPDSASPEFYPGGFSFHE
jgi:hypothetical protein